MTNARHSDPIQVNSPAWQSDWSAAAPTGRELRILRGTRAAEADLLATLEALAAEGDPLQNLAHPVRVIVPSRSLAQHLCAAIVRGRGRALAGVRIDTAAGLARELAREEGLRSARPSGLFEICVVRAARNLPDLTEELGHLDDGYTSLAAGARDLVDAGFNPALAPALIEASTCGGPGGPGGHVARARERAAALVRTTVGALDALGSADAEPMPLGSADLLRCASAFLAREPQALAPARVMLIYGFANATGLVADLLERCMRHERAVFWLDAPPDPLAPMALDSAVPGALHAERLRERIAGLPGISVQQVDGLAPAAHIDFACAQGAEAEVRHVGRRVRALIDAGVQPELISILARDLGPYRAALRSQLPRMAVPFSGAGEAGFMTPVGRRLALLMALLARGEGLSLERWLELTPETWEGPAGESISRAHLSLGLRHMGFGRLRDLTAGDERQARKALRLPLVLGFEESANGEEPAILRAQLPPWALAQAHELAGKVLARCTVGEGKARPFARFAADLHKLAFELLGWEATGGAAVALKEALARIAEDLPQAFVLGRDEAASLLERALEERLQDTLGGTGGGVQVLSVMEARGRSAPHVFLMGVGRDIFPRTITEDPLLPDVLRRELRHLLPDLPVKQEGFEEEAWLFAQMLSCGDELHISWQIEDEDGRDMARSPLVEALVQQAGEQNIVNAPALLARASTELEQSAGDALLLAAVHGGQAGFAAELGAALAEERRDLPASAPADAELARARLAVLAEYEAPAQAGLGPYFGTLGPAQEAADPRNRRLFITTLEGMARCPWQTFLRRFLGLAPLRDPLAILPSLHMQLVGTTTHEVLQRLVDTRRATALADGPLLINWPAQEELAQFALQAAERVLREEGIALPGLAAALAELALPFVERAAELDGWRQQPPLVLGSEMTESFGDPRADSDLRLWFKSDRADEVEGRRLLTDYKTGKPITTAKTEKTRAKHLMAKVARGEALQAAAYVESAEGSRGRYLYLSEDVVPGCADLGMEALDEDLMQAARKAIGTVLDVWDAGEFPPRLVQVGDLQKRGEACAYCDIASACLQGDTGQLTRMRYWLEEAAEGEVADGRKDLLQLGRSPR